MKSLLFYLFTLGALICISSADPIDLTSDNFDSAVLGSGKHSFIKFYAPWCGHCKKLAPTWAELSDAFADKSSVQIAKLDCTAHGEICTKYKVTGYPTLKYFKAGESEAGDYSGGRDLESLKKFVKETLDSGCDISDLSTCDEKETEYLEKMKSKSGVERMSESERLRKLNEKDNKMKPELKQWLVKRINILKQL